MIVRLMGGLGNQLFQVAAGCYVARVHGRRVRYETSWYAGDSGSDTPRDLEVAAILRDGEHVRLPAPAARVAYSTRNPFLRRQSAAEDDVLAAAGSGTRCLEGYFQRAAYPLAVRDDLAARILPVLAGIAPLSSTHGALGLHIRLGDYHANAATRAHHGVTGVSYYRTAVEELTRRHDYSRLVVITDTPQVAAREYLPHLPLPAEIIAGRSAWETLADLAGCAGLVMANSSLSWWAGFVATALQRRNAVVVKPAPWFGAPSPSDRLLSIDGWLERDRTAVLV